MDLEQRKDILCCNCGITGHVYRKCSNPITSFGIICFKKDKNNITFLLVKRKDSLAFAEFVRVKYDITDTEYLKKLLVNMTKDELLFLKNTKNADDIWNKLWTLKRTSRTRMNEYVRVKKKLILLIHGLKNKEGSIFTLKSLISTIVTTRDNPEWGFPKGRRYPRETDIVCAIREFCEETNIDKKDITILNLNPVEEIFTGSNNIIYKHIYYIAELKNNIKVEINPNNIHQVAEIGDIQWFSKEEAIQKIENKNKERINIITDISDYLFSEHNYNKQ